MTIEARWSLVHHHRASDPSIINSWSFPRNALCRESVYVVWPSLFQWEITAAFTYPKYHSNCPGFCEAFLLSESEGAVVAGSQVEIARDPRLGLGLLPWRLAGPSMFVVERVDQLHCVLQVVEAMPLVMFPAPSLPSDEIARLVPSINQDSVSPHNLLHLALAIPLQFVLDCRIRVGC